MFVLTEKLIGQVLLDEKAAFCSRAMTLAGEAPGDMRGACLPFGKEFGCAQMRGRFFDG
jgi:hypothetical protein